MSIFPEWRSFAVPQRRLKTGCIPTGYEMILRAAHVSGIEFASFQDDFDLDKDSPTGGPYRNNFKSVAASIQAKYPRVCFEAVRFDHGKGGDKLIFVEQHLQQKSPLLISLALEPFGWPGHYHIMPVVDIDDDTLTLLVIMKPDGNPELLPLAKQKFVQIHDSHQGGDDVAYLKSY